MYVRIRCDVSTRTSSWKSSEKENVSRVTCRILGENVDIDFFSEREGARKNESNYSYEKGRKSLYVMT
jgi:hypothetical protein